jgi:hypothetical protein
MPASGTWGGFVRIVGATENCTRFETARHWSITGPAGPRGAQGAQGPQGNVGPAGPALLTVFDSTGKKVGEVISFLSIGQALVAFKLNTLSVVMDARPDILGGTSPGYVFFESTDCSTTPFLTGSLPPTGTGILFAATAVGGPGSSTLYVATGPLQTINARAYWPRQGDNPAPHPCINFGGQIDTRPAYPAAAIMSDLDSQFIPPFIAQ